MARAAWCWCSTTWSTATRSRSTGSREIIERMTAMGLAVSPPRGIGAWRERRSGRRGRVGARFDYTQRGTLKPIVYADGVRSRTAGSARPSRCSRTRAWSCASTPGSPSPCEDGTASGACVARPSTGRQALLGDVVIDASGDADVALAGRGARRSASLHGHDRVPAGRRGYGRRERRTSRPTRAGGALNREAEAVLGGSWALWWLKTPLPGVIWCNCPHMTGYDGTSVEDLTAADADGRRRIDAVLAYAAPTCRGSRTLSWWTSHPRSACARRA